MIRGYQQLKSVLKNVKNFSPTTTEGILLSLIKEAVSHGKIQEYAGKSDASIIRSLSLQKIECILDITKQRVLELLEQESSQERIEDLLMDIDTSKKILKVLYLKYTPEHLEDKPEDVIFETVLTNYDFVYFRSFDQIEDFRYKLERVIAATRDEYANLDKKSPRKDGSTHLSHAVETTMILITEIGYFDEEMIFATIMHDYLEDTKHLNQSDKMTSMRLILQNTSRPEAWYDKTVIPLVQSLSKFPLEHYFRDEDQEDITYFTNLAWSPATLDEAYAIFNNNDPEISRISLIEKKLKYRRERDYFWNIISKDKVPNEIEDAGIFILKKMTIKCADRIHALRHMDMFEEYISLEKQIKMIENKIRETREYFFPQLDELIKSSWNSEYLHTYWKKIRVLLEAGIEIAFDTLDKKKKLLVHRESSS